MEMFLRIALIVVMVVATIGYVSSQDTCEYAPNSRQMALEMQTLLAGLNNKVADLTETVQKQGSTIAKLKAKLSKMNQTDIAAWMHQNQTNEAIKNTINDIKTEGQDIVAFSARQSSSSTELSSLDTAMYPRVDTNIGNHYDGQTSVFTCPYTGLYLFHISVRSDNGRHIGLYIMIDSVQVAYVFADGHGSNDYDSASALTIHRCEAGSEVYVQCSNSGRLGFGSANRFTGLLIRKL